jgi:alkylation response protein AidB-like acyl-CoA dehydrogenase
MDQRDRLDLVRSLAPVVERQRAEMEAQGRLHPEVVEGLRACGVLRAAVPPELDGPALDPAAQIELVEELSRLDGAVGWCAMIAAASSFVAGYLEPEAAERWFGPSDACLAGQLQPTGRAERVDGGYVASGRFRFASGVAHSTMLLAGCAVTVGGEVARHDDGRPELRTVLFRPQQCTVLDTWDTTGLRATGSHDYVIDELFVPEADSYDPSRTRRDEPLYRFAPLFLAPHYGVPLGIARTAVDCVLDLAQEKGLVATGLREPPRLREHEQVQEAVAVAEAELGGARALCYETVGGMWATLVAGERISRRQRGMYRVGMTHCHQVAKRVVGSMYDAATTSSIERGSPLDRQLRDVATACQHRMVHTRVYAPAGRLLLGMDSGDPTV